MPTPPRMDRPVHPIYGEALSGRPDVVGDIIFRPYRRSINRFIRVSDDGRMEYWDNPSGNTYSASLDGVMLQKRFRSAEAAIKALIKAAKTKG